MSTIVEKYLAQINPLMYLKGFLDGEQKIVELLEKSNIRFWSNPFYSKYFSNFFAFINYYPFKECIFCNNHKNCWECELTR